MQKHVPEQGLGAGRAVPDIDYSFGVGVVAGWKPGDSYQAGLLLISNTRTHPDLPMRWRKNAGAFDPNRLVPSRG